jgi:hypothetical protein
MDQRGEERHFVDLFGRSGRKLGMVKQGWCQLMLLTGWNLAPYRKLSQVITAVASFGARVSGRVLQVIDSGAS